MNRSVILIYGSPPRMIIEPSNNELLFHGGIRRDEKTVSGNTVLNNVNIVPYIRCASRCVETRMCEFSNTPLTESRMPLCVMYSCAAQQSLLNA